MSQQDQIAALDAAMPKLNSAEKTWAESLMRKYETPGGHITSREWDHVDELVAAAALR